MSVSADVLLNLEEWRLSTQTRRPDIVTGQTAFLDHIESNVRIDGEFDESQRKRLAQIATRCPVHRTLANGVIFKDNATFA